MMYVVILRYTDKIYLNLIETCIWSTVAKRNVWTLKRRNARGTPMRQGLQLDSPSGWISQRISVKDDTEEQEDNSDSFWTVTFANAYRDLQIDCKTRNKTQDSKSCSVNLAL